MGGAIHIWDTTTGALLRRMQEDLDSPFPNVQFSPTNSSILASVGATIRLWDVDSGEVSRSMEGLGFAVFSPDGRLIATGSPNLRDVLVVDVASGNVRARMVGHGAFVTSAQFSVNDEGGKLTARTFFLASRSHDDNGANLSMAEAAPMRYLAHKKRPPP
ncbi:hypothetical protein T484DRAFT_1793902 [Baffinella frigidus]|nr:hypothetical protein T484DRAFT_1793902 [Cryptophyta sp. CCMP2293]